MRKSVKVMLTVCAALMLTVSGCGKKEEKVEITPTPAPTATPTAVPPTATPAPTSTPAPRAVGVKTAQSKFIYLTNSTGSALREIYVKTNGNEDWGKNMVSAESSVKAAEQVQMFYTPAGSEEEASYDMKVVTADGDSYEMYSLELEDMEKATLSAEDGIAFLKYMSISEKKEKNTRDTSESSDDSDDSYDDYDSSYDDSYDESGSDYDNSYDYNEDYDEEYEDTEYDYEDEDYGYEEDYNDGDGYVEEEDSDYDDSYEGEVVWDENGDWTEG